MPTLLYRGSLNVNVTKVTGLPNLGVIQPDRNSYDPVYWQTAGLNYAIAPQVGNGKNINAVSLLQLFDGGIGGYNEIDFTNNAGAASGYDGSIPCLVWQSRVFGFAHLDPSVFLVETALPPVAYNRAISYQNIPCVRKLKFALPEIPFGLTGLNVGCVVAFTPGISAIGIYYGSFGHLPGFYFYAPQDAISGVDIGPLDYPGSDIGTIGFSWNTGHISPDIPNGLNYMVLNGIGAPALGVQQVWGILYVSGHPTLQLLQDSQTIFIDAFGTAQGLTISKACQEGFLLSNAGGTVWAFANRTLTQYWMLAATEITTGTQQPILNPLIDERGYLVFQNASGTFTSFPAPLNLLNPFSSVYDVPMFPLAIPCFDPCAFEKRNS